MPPALAASALVAALLGFARPAFAHDAWIDAAGRDWTVRYGHGETFEPFAPDKVVRLAAADADGRPIVPVPGRPADDRSLPVSVPGPAGRVAWIALAFDNGTWTRGPEGWLNRPREAVAGAETSIASRKFGRTMLRWGEAAGRPAGFAAELLPAQTSAPRAGGRLAVRLLVDGRPAAGVPIVGDGAHDGPPLATTDARGRATVPVRAGWQMVVAERSDPSPGAGVDRTTTAANLRFRGR